MCATFTLSQKTTQRYVRLNMYKLKTPISGNKMVTIENVVIILIIIALHCKLGDLISDKKMKAQQQNLKKKLYDYVGRPNKKLNT